VANLDKLGNSKGTGHVERMDKQMDIETNKHVATAKKIKIAEQQRTPKNKLTHSALWCLLTEGKNWCDLLVDASNNKR